MQDFDTQQGGRRRLRASDAQPVVMGNTQCMPLGQASDGVGQSSTADAQPRINAGLRRRSPYKNNAHAASAAAGGHLAGLTKLAAALTASSGGTAALMAAVSNPNWAGQTPLMLAAKKGHADCVAFLLQCGGWPHEGMFFALTRMRLNPAPTHAPTRCLPC